jgi:hypothetical protein
MKKVSKLTVAGLAVTLVLTFSLGFKCTEAQKQAVVDISLSHLTSLLGSAPGALGDAGSAVSAFARNRSEGNFNAGAAAFDAVLARHNLSAKELEIARTAMDIFKAFAPATFAEMDPDSEDARGARKELEDKFKRLEKLVGN